MQRLLPNILCAAFMAGLSSGCVVLTVAGAAATVAGTAVSIGATVVETTVDVAAAGVKAAVGSDEDKKDEKKE